MVINEIAWAGTAANAADEWIELFNAGDSAIDLTGWALYEGDTRIIPLSGTILAGGYFLVERSDDATVSDIPADIKGTFGGSGLKNNPGEDVRLVDAAGAVIDRVDCSGGWFFGSASPEHASMERVNPLGDGSDPANWMANDGVITTGLDAAGSPIRGTPKYRNSAYPQ